MSDGDLLGVMENCDLVLSQRRETHSASVVERGKCWSCFSPLFATSVFNSPIRKGFHLGLLAFCKVFVREGPQNISCQCVR